MTDNENTPEPEYINIRDMRQLATATIKFRGVLVHADCRAHNDIVITLVHLKQNGKMYATVVNGDNDIDMFVTRHKLTMWLHKKINTLELQEVNVNDVSMG